MKVLFSIDAASISSGFRSMFAGRRRMAVLTSMALAASLQGCADVPIHRVANWRAEPDYLVKGQFTPPGGPPGGIHVRHQGFLLLCSAMVVALASDGIQPTMTMSR